MLRVVQFSPSEEEPHGAVLDDFRIDSTLAVVQNLVNTHEIFNGNVPSKYCVTNLDKPTRFSF